MSTAEASQDRLFSTIELLLMHFLKSDMRKQISPQVIQVAYDQLNGRICMREVQNVKETLNQYTLKSAKRELVLLEMDTKCNIIQNAFFVQLSGDCHRVSFGLYKAKADGTQIQAELESLVENVLANLKNDFLVQKLSKSSDLGVTNHRKDDLSDGYDDALINSEMKISELTIDEQGKAVVIPNLDEKDKQKDNARLDTSEVRPSSTGERAPNSLNESSIDHRTNHAHKNRDDTSIYGITPGSVKPEVYSNYKKKLTELLNSVYLEGNSWTLNEDKGGLKYWTKDDPVYVIQRSEMVINHPLEVIKEYICDLNFRFKYDTLIKKAEFIEKMTDQVALIYVVMKGSFPVSDRDFLTCRASFFHNKDVN